MDIAHIEHVAHRQFALDTQQILLNILKREFRIVMGDPIEVKRIRSQIRDSWNDNRSRWRPRLQRECYVASVADESMWRETQCQRGREVIMRVKLGSSGDLE